MAEKIFARPDMVNREYPPVWLIAILHPIQCLREAFHANHIKGN